MTTSPNVYLNDLAIFYDFEPKGSLSFLHANIRSLRKNYNNFVSELSQINTKVDFIIISEIWINEDELNLYKLPGYNVFANCNNTYRAGGVLCFVSENINVSHVGLDMETADSLLLNVCLENSFFNLLCLYRLQSYSELNFINELSIVLQNIKNNTIYVGDINVNLDDNSPTVQNYISLLSNNGYTSFINNPTRITEFSKTTIDHIFVRHPKKDSFKSVIFDIGLTDHCLIGLSFQCSSKFKKINNVTNKQLGEKVMYDYNLAAERLKSVDWNVCLSISNVNICYDLFLQILTETLDSCKLIAKRSKLAKAKMISPWINLSLLRRIKRRKKFFVIYRKRPYDQVFKSYFLSFSNKLKNDIDTAKNEFLSNKIRNCNGDSTQYWKVINSAIGSSTGKNVDKIELTDGQVISNPMQVADAINAYLISVQSQCSSNSGIPPPLHCPCMQHRPHSLFIEPVDTNEILNIIKDLKNKKSTGFDNISVDFVKKVALSISTVLVHIINLSLTNGVFPDKLKISTVVPIFKKAQSCKIDNIRPISLLSIFSKIIEKVMRKRLVKYLDNINFFNHSQFGFRKGMGTEDALLSVTDKIYNNFNTNTKTTGLFIDFKTAFDLVDHNILLSKLEASGIRGVALSWFNSFLSNRAQKVKIGHHFSSPLPVKAGVPQGSVLSATLFLIFINDLLESPFHGSASAFADDIALFYSERTSQEIWTKINADLEILNVWCHINKMKINVNKTKYVNFNLVNTFEFPARLLFHELACLKIDCKCEAIEKTKVFKYLGLTLDENLNWHNHILNIHKKIKSSIRIFYYLKNFCDPNLLRILYFALVDSRLQYGIQCWGGTFKQYIDKLRISQNHLVRLILNCPIRESSFPLFCHLKILPVQHLYTFKVLKIFYIRSGNTGTQNLLYQTRRNSQKYFRLPKVNKSVFKQSYQYCAPKYFNQLPQIIKDCPNLKHFMKELKCWLFTLNDVSFLNFSLV